MKINFRIHFSLAIVGYFNLVTTAVIGYIPYPYFEPSDCQAMRSFSLTVWLSDMAVFENRQPVTEAKFIIKSSLFILLLGVIRQLELKPNNEQ
ncbi:MAG: hypothetical protein ABI172_03305 [Ginsengibacter sp.]|jgi:hypothetical protein